MYYQSVMCENEESGTEKKNKQPQKEIDAQKNEKHR